MAYLFITLEYSSRGVRSLEAYSLDETVLDRDARKIESVIQDSETGEIRVFGE